MRRDINEFIKGKKGFMLYFFGIFALIIGLLVVLSHNVWEADYRVVITIIGWLALIKGIAYLTLPWGWFKSIVNWANKTGWYVVWAIIGLIAGAYVLNEVTTLF